MAAKESEQLISLSSNIKVNPTKQVVYKNSEVLTLSYRNNNIFWLLFNNLNRTVSYDVIQDYIYDDEYVSKSAIRMAVSRVASIIGKDLIENISGIGYMLKSKT
jgi:DNA-binding response OmpR family regulator